ncbi:MAG: divergent polysaccharide deacetylase family protein, partial [Pseudomonadota bacterium]
EGEDNQLTVGMSEGELRQAVDNAVQRIGGAVGVNNHMGSLFTADEASMRIVLDQINSHGLVFIDSLTTPDSVAREVAVDLGMPYLRRDVFLDHDRNPEAIKKQLDELESVALERGWAVAIGHPYMETIDALAAWLPTLQRKGITLAPVSTLIRLENTDTQTAQRPDN